ncbi:hypothetical protein WS57_28115 [Burkholderia pseudomultivorans]|nr:hypothetical protein WS57_28115 [Burkholderia pseudomultivorans]
MPTRRILVVMLEAAALVLMTLAALILALAILLAIFRRTISNSISSNPARRHDARLLKQIGLRHSRQK